MCLPYSMKADGHRHHDGLDPHAVIPTTASGETSPPVLTANAQKYGPKILSEAKKADIE